MFLDRSLPTGYYAGPDSATICSELFVTTEERSFLKISSLFGPVDVSSPSLVMRLNEKLLPHRCSYSLAPIGEAPSRHYSFFPVEVGTPSHRRQAHGTDEVVENYLKGTRSCVQRMEERNRGRREEGGHAKYVSDQPIG